METSTFPEGCDFRWLKVPAQMGVYKACEPRSAGSVLQCKASGLLFSVKDCLGEKDVPFLLCCAPFQERECTIL